MTAKDTRDLLGGDKMFWNQIVGLVAQLCEFTKKKPRNCILQKGEYVNYISVKKTNFQVLGLAGWHNDNVIK